MLKHALEKNNVHFNRPPVHSQGWPGDVLHSQADIGKAERNLNYAPVYSLQQGLDMTVLWYIENHGLPIVAGHAARKLHAASVYLASSNLEVFNEQR